jgi:hypothetical protein
MRNFGVLLIAVLFFVSLACGPRLQPAQQGEWSNFHDTKDQVSENARQSPESH